MATPPKAGPLTAGDLRKAWRASVDDDYARALEAAGDGGGIEAHAQAHAQLAAASEAIDRTTQAIYVNPWSGQSSEPAGGERRAEVVLAISRSAVHEVPLLFEPGQLVVGEVQVDYGEGGGVEVETGRAYALAERLVLMPGEAGPVEARFVSTKGGYGGNRPLPGTIRGVRQEGARFENSGGSVAFAGFGPADPSSIAAASLACGVEPHVVVPGHVAAVVEILSGANAGQRWRAAAYFSANGGDGGRLSIDLLLAVSASSGAAELVVGEQVELRDGSGVTGYAELLAQRVAGGAGTYLLRRASGVPGGRIRGTASAATVVYDHVLSSVEPVAEAGTATWRVASWSDVGLAATNAASPAGGRSGMLDARALDRNMRRREAEPDDVLRRRISRLSDVVSPNALVRAANRAALAALNAYATMREVGELTLPGMYLDRDALDQDSVAIVGAATGTFEAGERVSQDVGGGVFVRGVALSFEPGAPATLVVGRRFKRGAFDASGTVTGERSGASLAPASITGGLRADDARRYLLDYAEFRGFMLFSVPAVGGGDFGFAWDVGFLDAGAALDGYALDEARGLRRVWQEIEAAKAGGVGFDIERE